MEQEPQAARRELFVLLLAGALLFTANARALSLPALDDAFYARKAVEMERTGRFYTVTWGERPAYQNPPLQIWIMGRSLALFGENDLAARLPSILMALGILIGVYRVGQLTIGPAAGVGAAALLLLSPTFVNHARRAMLEVPLAFWVLMAVLVLIEGLRRPRVHALLALPLGAAILTKSALGLLPLGILAAGAIVFPPLRGSLRRGWIWLGIVGGLTLGASWTVHQLLVFGPDAVRAHYLDEILSRSTQPQGARQLLLGYPAALLGAYQPVVLPGLVGAVLLWRRRRENPLDPSCLLPVWIALPTVLYSLSSARSARYLFPIFPALALCASYWMTAAAPRLAAAVRRWVAPAVAVAAAVVFWVRPGVLGAAGSTFFKHDTVIRSLVPEGELITYLGTRGDYWALANAILYYTERGLDGPSESAAAALRTAATRHSGLILVQRSRLPELQGTRYDAVLERAEWVLVRPHLDPGRGSEWNAMFWHPRRGPLGSKENEMKLRRAWRAGAAVALAGAALLPACSRRKQAEVNPIVPSFTVSRPKAPLGSAVEITYTWTVEPGAKKIPENYRAFVGFSDPHGVMLFEDDHVPTPPPSAWEPGKSYSYTRTKFIPIYPYVGEVDVRMGLYPYPGRGERIVLKGDDAGMRAYRVAKMELLPQTENIFLVYKDGWHSPESSPQNPTLERTWTKKDALVSFKNPKKDIVVYLEADTNAKAFDQPPVLTLAVAGKTGVAVPIPNSEVFLQKVRVKAQDLGNEEWVDLRLSMNQSFVPKVKGVNAHDERELGLLVYHLYVGEADRLGNLPATTVVDAGPVTLPPPAAAATLVAGKAAPAAKASPTSRTPAALTSPGPAKTPAPKRP